MLPQTKEQVEPVRGGRGKEGVSPRDEWQQQPSRHLDSTAVQEYILMVLR